MTERPGPDYRHPDWCSPQHCCAPDRLAERGNDVPWWAAHHHFSAPLVVGPTDRSDPTLELQVWQTSDEPIEQGEPHITLTVRRPDVLSVESYDLGDGQVYELAERLHEIAEVLHIAQRNRRATGGDPGA